MLSKFLAVLLLLGAFLAPSASAQGGAASKVRSVTVLPSTCNPGNGVIPMDIVALSSGGTTTFYYCGAPNTWMPTASGAAIPPATFALTIVAAGQGSGNIVDSSGHINCTITSGVTIGPACSASFISTASVNLIATPGPDASTFVTWDLSSGCGTSTSCTIVMGAATVSTADFNPPASASAISAVQNTQGVGISGSGIYGLFAGAQSAGDLNVVAVSWTSSATLSGVSDTAGNTYTLASGPTTKSGSGATMAGVGTPGFPGYSSTHTTSCPAASYTAGDLVVVSAAAAVTSGVAPSAFAVSSALGNVFTAVDPIATVSGKSSLQLWWSIIANAGTDTVTLTQTTSGSYAALDIGCKQYSNPAPSSPVDDHLVTNAASSTAAIALNRSLVTTNPSDLLVCAGVDANSSSVTAGSGYSVMGQNLLMGFYEDQLNVTPGSHAGNATNNVSTNTWQIACAAFKAASAGNPLSQAVYYAQNVAAAAAGNTVTAAFSAAPVNGRLRLLEYGGMKTSGVFDAQNATTGASAAPSATLTVANNNSLLVGNVISGDTATTVSSGFTRRQISTGSPFVDAEDDFPVASGSATFNPTLNSSVNWVANLVSFIGNSGGSPPPTSFSLTIVGFATGVGAVISNTGGINCSIRAGITSGNCSASYSPGANVTLTATAATGSTFGAYNGGTCSTSPSCALVMNSNITVAAGFNSNSLAFTILNQPGITTAFYYPDVFSNQKIQGAGSGGPLIYGHLMPNSDAVIQNIEQFQTNGQPQQSVEYAPGQWSGGNVTGVFATSGDSDEGSVPTYFAKNTDPVYRVTNVNYPNGCGPNFASHAKNDGTGKIGNLVFHAPIQAQYTGFSSIAGADQTMIVWDISGDSGDISNGYAVGFYCSGCGFLTLPAAGVHAGTVADPIPFTAGGAGNYCWWDNPLTNSALGAWGSGGNGSDNNGLFGTLDRWPEMVYGHLNHAGSGNIACEATAGGTEPNTVFPSTALGLNNTALLCANPLALSPPHAAHFFFDYTQTQLDCMNPDVTTVPCTGADGHPITILDRLHYTLVEQLALYGWFQADTSGPASDPTGGLQGALTFYHVESAQSYVYYSEQPLVGTNPLTGTCPFCFQTFMNYFEAHCPVGPSGGFPASLECYDSQRTGTGQSAHQWTTRIFNNISGNMPGPGNGTYGCSAASAALGNCGPGKHLHIADPCVDVAAAGLASSGIWTACS